MIWWTSTSPSLFLSCSFWSLLTVSPPLVLLSSSLHCHSFYVSLPVCLSLYCVSVLLSVPLSVCPYCPYNYLSVSNCHSSRVSVLRCVCAWIHLSVCPSTQSYSLSLSFSLPPFSGGPGEKDRAAMSHEAFLLMANSQSDMDDWVRAIRRVIWAPFGGGTLSNPPWHQPNNPSPPWH